MTSQHLPAFAPGSNAMQAAAAVAALINSSPRSPTQADIAAAIAPHIGLSETTDESINHELKLFLSLSADIEAGQGIGMSDARRNEVTTMMGKLERSIIEKPLRSTADLAGLAALVQETMRHTAIHDCAPTCAEAIDKLAAGARLLQPSALLGALDFELSDEIKQFLRLQQREAVRSRRLRQAAPAQRAAMLSEDCEAEIDANIAEMQRLASIVVARPIEGVTDIIERALIAAELEMDITAAGGMAALAPDAAPGAMAAAQVISAVLEIAAPALRQAEQEAGDGQSRLEGHYYAVIRETAPGVNGVSILCEYYLDGLEPKVGHLAHGQIMQPDGRFRPAYFLCQERDGEVWLQESTPEIDDSVATGLGTDVRFIGSGWTAKMDAAVSSDMVELFGLVRGTTVTCANAIFGLEVPA